MNWEMVAGVVRHAATYLAGVLTANGILDESQGTMLVGVIVGVAGLGWSILAKKMGWGAGTTTTVITGAIVAGGSIALVAANDNVRFLLTG